MSLKRYWNKRDFKKTSEPKGRPKSPKRKNESSFVVQKHAATRLHWDFRLEAGGVLKSWAITKEPSGDTGEKRLAIETEDHPLEYAKFQGTIPAGEYGGGKVAIWDKGTFRCEGDVEKEMERGRIKVVLRGRKLRGTYVLVRVDPEGSGPKSHWLFFKAKPKTTGLKIPSIL
jgi:bifunctional non-homologous end joining protein LigD